MSDPITEFEKELQQKTPQELEELLAYHNRKYWIDNDPEISDEAYDALVRALAKVDPGNSLLSEVQAPAVSGTGKVIHRKPMLSLDKAYSLDELLDWAGKFCRSPQEILLVQPKYDGISALWSGGVLATRGDGFEGENISDKADLIELEHPSGVVPLKAFHGTARGEIVIRDDDFKNLYPHIRNRNGRVYKNSRNAVAGIMGLKDIREMLVQHAKLTLVDYSLHSWETDYGHLKDDWQMLMEKVEALPYPMDGIVVKIADEAYAESLGNTAHHPRGAIAFKFSGIRRTSRLLSVEWSFGKNCLTPVAEIEPVDISGTTIRRASLHNLQNVLDKDLQIGDEVVIERAGDVIPYIVSSSPGEKRVPCIIKKCPACGAELVWDLPELRCVNPDCFETRLQRLLSSVRSIGIERLGEPNLRKIMNTLNVRKLSDLFRLKASDFLQLEGFQRLSAENLYREIQSARSVPDWQILASLNIRGIGPNLAKSILRSYSLAELRRCTQNELACLDQVGPERAGALWKELRDQSDSLDELLSCVNLVESSRTGEKGLNAAQPTICFTGKMPEKRSYYQKLAEERGYEAVDSVTSTLSLLVAMNPEDRSSKLQKARKLGIPVKSLAEFLASPEQANDLSRKTEDEENVRVPEQQKQPSGNVPSGVQPLKTIENKENDSSTKPVQDELF